MKETIEIKTLWPIDKTLPFIVFIEGFVSIAVEIIALRQLLPVVGSSIIVTSLIIGIFLLFLALGYHRGGQIKQHFQHKLHTNFLTTALWLGIGLSYLFVIYFFYYLPLGTRNHIVWPLLIYLLVIISPMVYWLGQTVPITLGLARQQKSISALGGNVLGLNTLGSFLGAVVTSLIFMQYWGVAWAVVINTALLMLLILLLAKNIFSFLSYLLIASFALYAAYILNVKTEGHLFVLTNSYANYQIIHPAADIKIFAINNSASSTIDSQKHGAPYIELIKKVLFQDLKLRNARILVLGAGGFTLTAENAYGNHVTYVDMDEKIKKAAVPQFIPALADHLVIEDARNFVRTSHQHYDAIVVDVYSNRFAIPAYLLTQEYFLAVKEKLKDNGTVIFNMIMKPTLTDPYSKRIDNTVRAVFKNCMVIPLAYANMTTNVIYVCQRNDRPNDETLYTDNLNSSTTDSFEW